MIKNIIFDMDGVLIDSENAIRTACMMMFNEIGINPTHEDFMEFIGMGEDRFIGGVAEKYGKNYHTGMKDRAYEIYGDIANEYVITYDNVKEVIMELKCKDFCLAVASAADAVKVRINLACMGLSFDDFGAIVTGSDVEKKKPDPEIFLKAAKKIGADPAQSLVLEDAISGCNAAVAAGMRCVGVTTSFSKEQLLEAGAECTIPQVHKLLDIINNLSLK